MQLAENAHYKVLSTVYAGNAEGMPLHDYTIQNKETGEVRLLEGCMCLDMDVFDDDDFEHCTAVNQ